MPRALLLWLNGTDYGYKYNLSVNAYAQYSKEIGDHYVDVILVVKSNISTIPDIKSDKEQIR